MSNKKKIAISAPAADEVCPNPHRSTSNDEKYIPVKSGHPLSDAASRTENLGSIPEVCRWFGFTLVNGKVPAYKCSDGGIANPKKFFSNKSSKNLYKNKDAMSTASNCGKPW